MNSVKDALTMRQAANELLAADNILILCHKNPDGDAWGSAFALYAALKSLGKRVAVGGLDFLPALYSYLGDYCRQTAEEFTPEYIVSVDCSNEERLIATPPAQVDLCIDHHPSNTFYAKKTLVQPERAACCEIIYALLQPLGVKPDKYIGSAIYTGIATDTGCFKFMNTTAETHRIAAELFELGVKAGELNTLLFDHKTRARLALEKEAMNSLAFFSGGKIAIITISLLAAEGCGALETDFDGLTSISRSIEGVEFGITLREMKDYYKCSVRTGPLNACAVAESFGGGGHIRAAGFESKLPLSELIEKIVDECGKQL